MAITPEGAFDDVATALEIDPDDDVVATRRRLLVKGRLFAYLEGDRLAVDLPAARADDLVTRGIAAVAGAAPAEPSGAWVLIEDMGDWQELAAEAHQFVGEPPVGRQS